MLAILAACGVRFFVWCNYFLLSRIKSEAKTLLLFHFRNQDTSSCLSFCIWHMPQAHLTTSGLCNWDASRTQPVLTTRHPLTRDRSLGAKENGPMTHTVTFVSFWSTASSVFGLFQARRNKTRCTGFIDANLKLFRWDLSKEKKKRWYIFCKQYFYHRHP